MQLTRHTDYAFRVLIYLAAVQPPQLVTIQEISDCFRISRNHVMKVVQNLVRSGFIDSVRGQKGGIKLTRPLESINVRAVIECAETTLAPVNCEIPLCRLSENCRLQGILFEAQEHYLQSVGRYSLADLVRSKPMETLLSIH